MNASAAASPVDRHANLSRAYGKLLVGALAVLFGVAIPAGAHGEDISDAPMAPRAMFALIIGVNTSLQSEVAPLHYADDDAARYVDLFRALGARTYLLMRPDANTRRLHPQASAESVPPRTAEMQQAVTSLARDVAQARGRGVDSTLYLIYAGHGDVQETGWFLTLEDGRLSGQDLMDQVVARIHADQSHVIIDACHAYLLALPRGPGGTRRAMAGFVELEAALRAGHVGFLLSSSVSGESHEWAGFEAGVFSHEVRSGLYGAADADGDGQVTYSEIGAFVARANEAITNDRFRSRVLARAPQGSDLLVDLRGRVDHELRLDSNASAAHYMLENSDGVRLLDFHGSEKAAVHLVRPPGEAQLYLRRLSDGAEWSVPRSDGVVQMDRLTMTGARVQSRGAAHHAFSQIFSLSFDGDAVAGWARKSASDQANLDADEADRARSVRNARMRRIGGWTALGLGVAGSVTATVLELSAHSLRNEAPPTENHRDTTARNTRIDDRNFAATVVGTVSGVAIATGILLLLWPRESGALPSVNLVASSAQGDIGVTWRF